MFSKLNLISIIYFFKQAYRYFLYEEINESEEILRLAFRPYHFKNEEPKRRRRNYVPYIAEAFKPPVNSNELSCCRKRYCSDKFVDFLGLKMCHGHEKRKHVGTFSLTKEKIDQIRSKKIYTENNVDLPYIKRTPIFKLLKFNFQPAHCDIITFTDPGRGQPINPKMTMLAKDILELVEYKEKAAS